MQALASSYRSHHLPASSVRVSHERRNPICEWLSYNVLQEGHMAFKDEGYDDERFWEQVRSENPTFLGFWTHR